MRPLHQFIIWTALLTIVLLGCYPHEPNLGGFIILLSPTAQQPSSFRQSPSEQIVIYHNNTHFTELWTEWVQIRVTAQLTRQPVTLLTFAAQNDALVNFPPIKEQ